MPPRESSLVHPLPPAPAFVGREAELTVLRRSWSAGFRGVLVLIGLGGAGKTAVAARFVEDVRQAIDLPMPRKARKAWQKAMADRCRFLWGAAPAGHLLGEALRAQQRVREARKVLRQALALRRRIGDPRADATAALLRSLRARGA